MTDSRTARDIDSFIAENSEQLFSDISRLVAINSVNGPEEPGAPFGRGPAAALDEALRISKELGLEACNLDYKIGTASVPSNKENGYLATITHVDVVPAGNGWNSDPFTMLDRDGYILGRGVIDDKGPTVLSLYALKYFVDRNITPRHELRALIGSNEEIAMGDVEYYLENYPAPLFCFSPDADFPLVNGEKGIWHAKLTRSAVGGNISNIWGGLAVNAVPDRAEAIIESCDAEKVLSGLSSDPKVTAELSDGKIHLTAYGVGGHASVPAGTENAIGILADYILRNSLATEEENGFLRLIMKLHCASDGSGLGVNADDGLFDPLTIVGGVIGMDDDGRIFQTLDCRYPTNMSGEKLARTISAQAEGIAELSVINDTVPFYMSLDNPAVQVCIDAYNSVTGENAAPFTIGGGTYARHFPNAASFGPEHSDRPMPEWCGSMHGANEAACKADFLEALKVYITALLELDKLDF